MQKLTYEELFQYYVSENLDPDERSMAATTADGLRKDSLPLAETIALIPVAAHQDADLIPQAMSHYAAQRKAKPLSIILHLNTPEADGSQQTIANALARVDEAKDAYPELDIRTMHRTFLEPKISLIKRQMWAGALVLAQQEGLVGRAGQDIIGLNHDIDTVAMSPHYTSRVQAHFAREWQASAEASVAYPIARLANTRMSLAALATHPNVGNATAWIDNTRFQKANHVGYEAGMAIPFAFYMQRGGFDSVSTSHETHWTASPSRAYLSEAQIWTSPRRFIERLGKYGRHNVWADGSFNAVDSCRGTLPPDVSKAQVDEILFDGLQRDIEESWVLGGVTRAWAKFAGTVPDVATRKDNGEAVVAHAVRTQLQKAEKLMRIVSGSPFLADVIRDSFDADKLTHEHYRRLTNQV